VELTPANWDTETAGKTAFVMFRAPWCGHCKAMKPDWEQLDAKYAGNSKIVIGAVDCTAAGKPLCDANGVKGFPTLKHGDPANLDEYEGGRDFASLDSFASQLKPVCSPANLDLCDPEDKEKIVKVQALSDEELDAAITEGDTKVEEAEQHFNEELEKLQAAYKALVAAKDKTVADVKASGIGMLKAVRAARRGGKGHTDL